jgi:erythromycin esterase-like protein
MHMDDVRELALPLREAVDLDPLLARVGDARVVAVGEAGHGTHEYHAWRAALTRRLVEEHGSGLVAVEGDRPDRYRVTRSVRLRPGADDDVVHLCRWLPDALLYPEETTPLQPLHLERPDEHVSPVAHPS